jgi:hypothetical protein
MHLISSGRCCSLKSASASAVQAWPQSLSASMVLASAPASALRLPVMSDDQNGRSMSIRTAA